MQYSGADVYNMCVRVCDLDSIPQNRMEEAAVLHSSHVLIPRFGKSFILQDSKVMIAPEIEPKLTEAQVRAAMLSHIASHCCYGKAAAKNMVVKKMEYLPAYHYELQTFTEKRETSWTYAAIRAGYESILGNGGLGGGVPPLPWVNNIIRPIKYRYGPSR